jgi:hypothetical protein
MLPRAAQPGPGPGKKLADYFPLVHRKSTPAQPDPYIWCALFLTLLASRLTIRQCLLLLSPECERKFARRGHWGKHDAIFAGMDRAVHQSRLFCAGALVAGTSLWSQCGVGVLPQLRKFLAGGAAAHWPAPSYAAPSAGRAAVAAQAPIDFSVGVAILPGDRRLLAPVFFSSAAGSSLLLLL